nr:MAG TPA: Leucophaea maderae tachykinin-related peptide [Caudoviricetes sp.]
MISLYLGWSGFQGVRFLLPVIVCQTLKIKNE